MSTAVAAGEAGPGALLAAEEAPVDRSKHPSGIVPQLQNVVATVDLGCKLELKDIALHARNAEYNPKVQLLDSCISCISNLALCTTLLHACIRCMYCLCCLSVLSVAFSKGWSSAYDMDNYCWLPVAAALLGTCQSRCECVLLWW